PFVRRALEVDDVVIVARIDRIARDGKAARAKRLLNRPAEHHIHAGLPIQCLREELEHETLVHSARVFPKLLAITENSGALAVFDDFGEDIHVGRELTRLAAIALTLPQPELD